jgi:5-methyltetrahydrofolate--homocysteine methyltransferase
MERLKAIAENVLKGQFAQTYDLVQLALDEGASPEKVLNEGLLKGIEEVGRLFKEEEIYVPEMLMAAKAMQQGMDVLEPLLVGEARKNLGKIVLGTVKGDLHDLGKYLVSIMLRASGFEVIDIGIDISADKFISRAVEEDSRLIGMSALLTTTMPYMKTVVDEIEKAGLKTQIKTIIGGTCVTQDFADKIGADAYGANAGDAVEKAKQLLGEG